MSVDVFRSGRRVRVVRILGFRYGHDAAAAIIVDGVVIADAAEERFSRVKNDTSFPVRAIQFCLEQAGISSEQLDCVAVPSKVLPPEAKVFFDIPDSVKIESKESFTRKIGRKVKRRLWPERLPHLPVLPIYEKPFKLSQKCYVHLCEHHLAHAASAYYTSGLDRREVLIVTMDGVGDGVSIGLWQGQGNRITALRKWGGDASIGWFYANATEGLGWRQSCDEWKVMGLAPYGTPQEGLLNGLHPEFRDGELVRPHDFGPFGRWNDHGANHYHGRDSVEFRKIASAVRREDYAAETQRIAEEQMFNVILPWLRKTGTRHLCCAGGCFLNVKFNQQLWYKGVLDTQWIYPNPSDAGLAVGAALNAYFELRQGEPQRKIGSLYFGPEFDNEGIRNLLDERGLAYRFAQDVSKETAAYLARNLVVGWFQGRMESGPRALGNRSILMSPLRGGNKDIINSKIKYREAFRPFCPSILYEKADEYLQGAREECFMVTSFVAKADKRDKIPAVIHVDGTARPQMVKKDINPRFYDLITEFGKLTGEYAILNTSFNVKGEPIVCTPLDALKCFYSTGLDILVLGDYIIEKPNIGHTDSERG